MEVNSKRKEMSMIPLFFICLYEEGGWDELEKASAAGLVVACGASRHALAGRRSGQDVLKPEQGIRA